MLNNKYLIIGIMFLMLVAPIIAEQPQEEETLYCYNPSGHILKCPDNIPPPFEVINSSNKIIAKMDGLYRGNNKLHDKGNSPVWVDKRVGDIFHVDSIMEEDVGLYLEFNVSIQPDTLKQINHKGEFVRYLFPTQWEYTPYCQTEECETPGGKILVYVDGIDKGTGSSTFQIGIDGSTWANDGQFSGVFDGNNSVVEITSNVVRVNLTNEVNYKFSN